MNGHILSKATAAAIVSLSLIIPTAQAGSQPSKQVFEPLMRFATVQPAAPVSDVLSSRPAVAEQRQWEPLMRFATTPTSRPISDVQLSRGTGAAAPAALPRGSSGFNRLFLAVAGALAVMLLTLGAALGLRTRRRVATS